MKQIIVGLFIMLLVACSENDASGLYNYGKTKYTEAVNKGIAYKDSVARVDSGWVLLFRNKNDLCVYGNRYNSSIFVHRYTESYYKCDDTIISNVYKNRNELSKSQQSELLNNGF